MAVFDLTLPGHLPVTFVALHMTKPWFYGIIDQEIDTVEAVLPQHPGPMVLAGDLNSAPWSLRLRWLRELAGLRGTPLPVPTWPAPAGALGLPIDHVLVAGGPRVVSISPWGTETDVGSPRSARRAVAAESPLRPASGRAGHGGHGHFATGGRHISTASASCPVSSPKWVPRS